MTRPLLPLLLLATACSSAPNPPNLASWTGTIIPGEARACCVATAEEACGSPTSDVVVASTAGLPYELGCDGGQSCNAYLVDDAGMQANIVAFGTCRPDDGTPTLGHAEPEGRR